MSNKMYYPRPVWLSTLADCAHSYTNVMQVLLVEAGKEERRDVCEDLSRCVILLVSLVKGFVSAADLEWLQERFEAQELDTTTLSYVVKQIEAE